MSSHGIFIIIFVSALALHPDRVRSQMDTAREDTHLIDFSLFPETDPFRSDTILQISLKFDMRNFIRTKHKGEYLPAELSIYNLKQDTVRNSIRVRARGISRRSICYLPPIKLNFKNGDVEGDSLNDINSLKLVTHCKNSTTYEQYVLKEYLAYKMYNLLTDSSFRVKLLQIDYMDSEGKMKPITRYGFIIESHSSLAERLTGTRIDKSGINTWDTDTYHTNLTALFQYMIGNTDWAIPVPHNFKFVRPNTPNSNLLAIPYDFDYSGLVNTGYAVPDENLGIESVRTRVYRGYCLPSEEHYQKLFNMFLEKKRGMFALVEDFELLDKKSKRESLEYLEAFYHIIETPWMARREIMETCRSLPGR
jgi:hypothetical protein